MRVLTYKPSGEVVGHFSWPDGTPVPSHLQTDTTVYCIAHETAERGTHWVNNGVVTEYSEEAKENFANDPGPGFEWDPEIGEYLDVRSLEEAKAQAWRKVKEIRERKFTEQATTTTGIAYRITKDRENLANILIVRQAAQIPAEDTTEWVDDENVPHFLNLAQLQQLTAEMGNMGQAIYKHSWHLRDVIENCADVSAVVLVGLESGWPL